MEIKIIVCQNPVIPSFSVTTLIVFMVECGVGKGMIQRLFMMGFFITPESCLFRRKLPLGGGVYFSARVLCYDSVRWSPPHHFTGQWLRSQQSG